MIHTPYWLTNQSVDTIDAALYEEMHKEFMETVSEQNLRVASPAGEQLCHLLQEGLRKGGFWYSLVLDSPTGLFSIFYDHIQPLFSKDHIDDSKFWLIVSDYWSVDKSRFIKEKERDKEQYDLLLLEAFK